MAVITDAKARNMKPDDGLLPHGGVTGLALEPSATKGHGKWILRYTSPVTQKRRKAGLGGYPDVGIAEAGKKGMLFREQLTVGIEPLVLKAEAAQEAVKAAVIPLFKDAAETVYAELEPGWKNVKHKAQWINTLRDYAVPIIGEISIDQLEPRHIADVLRPIWLEIPETASRLKQRIHAVLAWGWAHGYCKSNPVDVVGHLLPQQPSKAVRVEHQPAMPWRIIPEFWKQHLSVEDYDVSRALLKFLILTAARSGEVRGMTWNEVDFDQRIWIIPSERMKAKFQHRVPLSRTAIEILKKQQAFDSDLVFPSVRAKKVATDMTMTMLLRGVNAPSDSPERTATAHGFRSSFRDWCSENNYPRDLAERALAHTVQNKVEAAYHRTDLLNQRRPMMEAWEAFVVQRTKSAEEAEREALKHVFKPRSRSD
ncbi:MAG TPA: tyrosine-type recombinase/integrase [Halothiobacillus sp.]|nr:tyrosine-type recombinase/integrase [Halothiobacillus sp.]